jgi:hypothetical protein
MYSIWNSPSDLDYYYSVGAIERPDCLECDDEGCPVCCPPECDNCGDLGCDECLGYRENECPEALCEDEWASLLEMGEPEALPKAA